MSLEDAGLNHCGVAGGSGCHRALKSKRIHLAFQISQKLDYTFRPVLRGVLMGSVKKALPFPRRLHRAGGGLVLAAGHAHGHLPVRGTDSSGPAPSRSLWRTSEGKRDCQIEGVVVSYGIILVVDKAGHFCSPLLWVLRVSAWSRAPTSNQV